MGNWESESSWCIREVKTKKFPVVFKSAGKNKKIFKENRELLRKIGFQQNRFWFLV